MKLEAEVYRMIFHIEQSDVAFLQRIFEISHHRPLICHWMFVGEAARQAIDAAWLPAEQRTVWKIVGVPATLDPQRNGVGPESAGNAEGDVGAPLVAAQPVGVTRAVFAILQQDVEVPGVASTE